MTHDEFLAALLSLPALDEPVISQDGRWVAWSWYRAGPAADVWAAPCDGSTAPLRLTETPHDTLVASWVPGQRAVIVSQDRDGDERAQLFRVGLDRPGLMQPLTEPSPQFFLRGGQLHPNGRWLVYAANWDEDAATEIEATWVYRHDLLSGHRFPLARPRRGCFYQPQLNQPGSHVLYTRSDRHPAGRQIWVVDIEGRKDREIINAGDDRKAWASWFPDGRRVLVVAQTGSHPRLGVWDLESGELRWLVDDPARNVESASVPPGSRHAVLREYRAARVRASLLDVDSGQETAFPDVPGDLLPLGPVPGRPAEWVGHYYSSRQPADLVRFAVADGQPDSFVSLTCIWERTSLRPADLAPAQDFRWSAADGLEIQGWFYKARGEPRGTVVYVHGGPSWHSSDRLTALIQYLVSRGFNVLDPNYRGSTGFSQAYREAIKASGWGGQEQEDIRAGIEALMAAGLARPGQVGITGTSYGGYSAWWAITHFPPRIVTAAAPICGMTDLVVDYQTTRPDLRPLSEEMMGGSPAEVPERYRERSPLFSVGNIRGRLLIVQGLQDPNVTPENVRVVRQALAEAGVAHEVLAFEDEGHGIVRPANQRVLYSRLADFFEHAFARSKPH